MGDDGEELPLAEEILGKHTLDRDDGPNMELLAKCIENSSAARGIDAYAVEVHGYAAAEWAEMTGRDQSTVARNVRRAAREGAEAGGGDGGE